MNPFSTETENPFDTTTLGLVTNTVLGIPKAAVQVGTDILQGIARSAGSAALSLTKPFGGVDSLQSSNIQNPFMQELFKHFFGTEPIKPIEDNIAKAELAIKANPFARKTGLSQFALPLAFGGVFGGDLLNLTPFGSLEKNATKALLKEETARGALKLLTSMKVPEEIATKFAPHFAVARTNDEVQTVFDTMKGVLGVRAKVEAPQLALPTGEGASAAAKADQTLATLPETTREGVQPLLDIVAKRATEVKSKVNVIDYLRTPDRVLEKIGFADEAKMLRHGYESYVKELPLNIDKITAWAKGLPAEASKTIFRFLDGQDVKLPENEMKIALEIKEWLAEWAKRLKLPEDKTITNYITHIFDKELIAKEFDEDLAKIITDKIPGSVYDPFLLKRLGAKGYKENVWEALDAYVKRATRKVNMDSALDAIQTKSGTSLEMSKIEASQFKYLQRYVSGVNMRPTELDNLLDNTIKTVVGYKYGQRPVTYLTKTLRQMTYRGMLGLNPGSALRNLSQGINTYAVLGEKYTAIGYAKLLSKDALREAAEQGVFAPGFIQDRALSSTKKAMERVDKGLFSFFELAERINRGAAYFGAKSKALGQGKSLPEAIDYAKSIVRKTQFSFGSIDTPVAVQSDIVKTLAQFQNYTLKQTEFLAEMVKDKNFIGLLRYGVAGMTFVYTVGKAFGMQPSDLIPSARLGVPPSLKFPYEVGRAALDAPDKYGGERDLAQKANDVGKAGVGLIPAGNQIRKSVQGLQAFNKGADTTATGRTRYEIPQDLEHFLRAVLFGKSSLPEAQAYYNKSAKPSPTSTSNPFNTH